MKILAKYYGLALGVSLSALFFSVTGFAQNTDQATGEAEENILEEVVVTGTRIKSSELTSPSPLQVVSSEFIEDLAVVNVQEALQRNPAFGIPGTSRFVSNGSVTNAGTATVNLRNLGANRTLVLVDGRRMIAGVPGTTQVDLALIPTEFIDRVEVLTGGASAVYGSDAVAGVVNLIYKRDYEGFIASGQYGISEEGDGDETRASVMTGFNFADGKGNFMITAAYSDQKALDATNRSFSDDSWYSVGVLNKNPDELFKRTLNRSTVHPTGTMAAGGKNYTFDENGNAIPWDINNQETRFDQAEFDSTRNIASPVERFTFASRLTYDITDDLNTIGDFTYGRVSSTSVYEAHPYVSNSNIIGINEPHKLENWLLNPATGETRLLRNPFIPDLLYDGNKDTNKDGLRDAAYSKRVVEFGQRTTEIDRQQFRILLGVEGNINSNWSYDAAYSYGRSDLDGTMTGLYNMPNLRAAMNVAPDVYDFDRDGNTTEPVCVDAEARSRGCVPINFYGLNNISDAALAYVKGASLQDSTQQMSVIAGNVSGTLFELPAGPLQVAGGLEYRDESSKHIFDPLSNTNQNGYVQLTNTIGSQFVSEIYGEVVAPIIDSLSLRGAYRYSDYSTLNEGFGAWNLGFEWRPIDSLMFRGTYAHAVRAPNIGELFAAPSAGVTAVTDPCQGVKVGDNTEVAQNCLADPGVLANAQANGGTVVFIQSDFQGVQTISGTNPNIAEETGKTWTVGMVFTPESVEGLNLTVDYYNIEIEDAINRVTSTTVLNKCYKESQQDFCDFVERRLTAATPYSAGSISLLGQGLVNSGGLFSEGVDLTGSYAWEALNGSMTVNGSYSYLIDQGIYPLTGDPADNFAGEIGFPTHKFLFTLGYDNGPWRASFTGTYYSASYVDDVFVRNLFGADVDPTSSTYEIDGKFYAATQVRYNFSEHYDVYLGINNLFDTDPPPIWGGIPGGQGDAYTNSGLYDIVGRFWYVGVRAEF